MSDGDAVRLARLEALFHEVADLEEAERSVRLADRRRRDPELVADVERLLARADAGRDLSALGGVVPHLVGVPGDRFGPYRLVERIGEGGMGAVYRAERADGEYEQTVAIKVIRGGPAAPDRRSRFRTERQILARLEHPNIARLSDGGVSDDGAPYLVMEHVEGVPITAFCDARRLSVEQRIDLFVTVCQAVAHAHRNLIVHRDLKPSNILVNAEGEVKLLDFGIAKLLPSEQEVTEAGPARASLPALTPAYASPEQVLGESVTTATDVYALGLLLHELLTGHRAQAPDDASAAALVHAVCETEVVPASAAVAIGSLRTVAARVGDRAAGGPASLRKRLRGDLDAIVAMALRKDPARRYPSARHLAEDLERHQTGWPVAARPDSQRYRAGTFLRRHRLVVASAAAVAVAVLAGLVLALVGMSRAQAAERLAVEEAAVSSEVVDLLVDLFQANDPGVALGDEVRARDLLDKGAARVDIELVDRPSVRARLLQAIGQAYQSLGLYPPAAEIAERRLMLERDRAGEQSPEAARALVELSNLRRRMADHAAARDLAVQAIDIFESVAEAGDASVEGDLAGALGSLGVAHAELGNLSQAGTFFERAVAVRERSGPPGALRGALNNLATLRWHEGDHEAARDYYERALAIAETEFPAEHPEVANLLNNLALVHAREDDVTTAIAVHERALAIRERVLDERHPDLAESLNNLGNLLRQHGDLTRSRAMLERALAIREQALGPDHGHVATTLHNLGLVHLDLGAPSAARPLFVRARSIFEDNLGPDHVMVSHPLLGLAQVDAALDDPAAAERGFLEALRIRRARMPAGHPDLVSALREHAGFLRDTGRVDEAEAIEREAAAGP